MASHSKSVELTPFGQYARKLRVDYGEFLKDMAEHLGVTSTYLSAVERGRRNAPYEWVERLQTAYNLDEEKTEELKRVVSESRSYDRLDISHLSFEDKQMMTELSKKLNELDDEKRRQLFAWVYDE